MPYLLCTYPTPFEADFLGAGYLQSLAPLYGAHELARLDEALMRTRVKPRKSPIHDLDTQIALI